MTYLNNDGDNGVKHNPYAPPKMTERKVTRQMKKLSPRLMEFYDRDREYDLYAIAETLGKFRWYERACLIGITVAGILFFLTGLFGLFSIGNVVFRTCATVTGCLMGLEFLVFTFWLYIIGLPAEWRLVKRMNDLMDFHLRTFNPLAFGDNQKYLAAALIDKHGYDPGSFWSGPDLEQFSQSGREESREHF